MREEGEEVRRYQARWATSTESDHVRTAMLWPIPVHLAIADEKFCSID